MPTSLALCDKVTFSIFTELRGMPPNGRGHLVESLKRKGWVVSRTARRVRLRVPVLDGRAQMEACLLLSESPDEGGGSKVTIRSGSVVRLNGLRLLRAAMGEAAPAVETLDGEDNVVGPTAGAAHLLLPPQLALVEEALDLLRRGIDDALVEGAGATRQEMRLREAELAVDADCPASRAFVHALGRCPMPGSLRVVNDSYRVRAVGGRAPCRAWYEGGARIYAKAYAKAEDLLRLEVAFASRAALEQVGSGVREVGGPEAAELLADLAERAHGRVKRALQHVVAARRGFRPMAALMGELMPLAALVLGTGTRPGRPPEDGARDEADVALEALMAVGHYDGRGLPKNDALRAALDRLSGPSGPLERARGSGLYTVRPLVPLACEGEAGEVDGDDDHLLALAA